MWETGGDHAAFDRWVFQIEIWGATLVIVCVLALLAWRGLGRYLPSWPAGLLVVISLVLGPGMAVFWHVAYPPSAGLDMLERLVFGGLATIVNAMLGLGAFVLLEQRVRWFALAPLAMVIGYWGLYFL